jgi:ribosomal protein L37E
MTGLIDRIKNLHPKKFIKFGTAPFSVEASDCSDCGDCNSKYTYDWEWVNREGYGTTAWAPTVLSSSRNFGLNDRGTDFLVTYL